MKAIRCLALSCVALLATACGTVPPNIDITPYDDEPFEYPAPSSPMVQPPPQPVEPVEPEPPAPAPVPAPAPPQAPPAQPSVPRPTAPEITSPPAPLPTAPPVVVPEVSSEDHAVVALVGDLARYTGLTNDDVKKEINSATQTLLKQRTDVNRVRLAMLYTLTHSAQDDQRALQLLDTVTRNNGSPALKQLAGVIQVQVNERVRAVREEQQKAEAAIQKLERLRELERNLLRDRLRSGGGGGSGGSGSGGSGGGR